MDFISKIAINKGWSDDKKYWEEEVKIKNSSRGFNSNITGIRLGITKIEK